MGVFLPQRALPGLKNYRYAGEDNSLVSRYVLKPLYTKLVNFLPLWLAPNMVTLMGLAFSLASFLRALYYNPNFNTYTTPRWVFFMHAFDMIAYQTFDALDGQQARRTKTSSPLGELFDHCVDALNTSLLTYVWASISNMSKGWVIAFEFLCTLNFIVSTWEEYHTKRLYLSVFSGPVEGVLMVAALEVFVGFMGQEIFDFTFLSDRITFREVTMICSTIGLLFNTKEAIANVFQIRKSHKLVGLLPFAVMWTGFALWAYVAWDAVSGDAFLVYFLTIAFTSALLVGRIITAHVTNQPYPMWNPLIAAPFIGALLHFMTETPRDTENVYGICGVALGIYSVFVAEIITEITTYLDIGCLYIKHNKVN